MEKNFYSVPFVYVGQQRQSPAELRRWWKSLVRIASPWLAHSRLTGVGKFSTYDAHYPEQKLSVARFEVHHAKEQAKKLGPQRRKSWSINCSQPTIRCVT